MNLSPVLFLRRSNNKALLFPDVVTSEKQTDTLNIVSHPVESGLNIADHAYMSPAVLTMDIGFSGGGSLVDFYDASNLGLSTGLTAQESYQQLLDLQKNVTLLNIVTKKRLYNNMLITSLVVTTDAGKSENALFASLVLTEVLITNTQIKNSSDKTAMQKGVGTSEIQSFGTKSTKPLSDSVNQSGITGIQG